MSLRHDIVWRYLPRRPVKHALLAPGSGAVAFCGRTPLWYAPESERWQSDEEGLAGRRACARCTSAVEAVAADG